MGAKGNPHMAPCKIYYCYRATNKDNGRVYIGFATDPQARWREHKRDAEKGRGYVFHDAIRKHGWDAFSFEILCCGKNKRDMLEYVEPALIEQYHSSVDQDGYNILRRPMLTPCGITTKVRKRLRKINKGSKNPFYGKKHSEATKRIMSELKKGKPSPRKGMILSEATKKKLSIAHTGHVCSEENKAKTSAALLGIKRSDEFKQKMRAVAANRSREHYVRKNQRVSKENSE
jgi:group I intron endonuclease